MVTKKTIKCNYEHVGSERAYNWLEKWRMRGEEPERKTVYDIHTHSMRHKIVHNYHTFISHRAKNGYGHSTFGQLNMTSSVKYTGVDGVHGRTRRITSHKTPMLISGCCAFTGSG
jgi:hypothetical protein